MSPGIFDRFSDCLFELALNKAKKAARGTNPLEKTIINSQADADRRQGIGSYDRGWYTPPFLFLAIYSIQSRIR